MNTQASFSIALNAQSYLAPLRFCGLLTPLCPLPALRPLGSFSLLPLRFVLRRRSVSCPLPCFLRLHWALPFFRPRFASPSLPSRASISSSSCVTHTRIQTHVYDSIIHTKDIDTYKCIRIQRYGRIRRASIQLCSIAD